MVLTRTGKESKLQYMQALALHSPILHLTPCPSQNRIEMLDGQTVRWALESYYYTDSKVLLLLLLLMLMMMVMVMVMTNINYLTPICLGCLQEVPLWRPQIRHPTWSRQRAPWQRRSLPPPAQSPPQGEEAQAGDPT